MEYEVPSWDEIYDMCVHLAGKVRDSGYSPDLILGVARGGWIVARILSDILDNPNVASLRVQFYEDVAKTSKTPRITQPVSAPVTGAKVLVVDDVADTGESLRAVTKHLKEMGAAEVRIATLHYKPKSVVMPEYFVRKTDAWIVYPHERFEFMRSKVKELSKGQKDATEMKKELLKFGLDERTVQIFLQYQKLGNREDDY